MTVTTSTRMIRPKSGVSSAIHKVATKWAWFASAVGSLAFTTAGRDTGAGIQHALVIVIAYTLFRLLLLLVVVNRKPAEKWALSQSIYHLVIYLYLTLTLNTHSSNYNVIFHALGIM